MSDEHTQNDNRMIHPVSNHGASQCDDASSVKYIPSDEDISDTGNFTDVLYKELQLLKKVENNQNVDNNQNGLNDYQDDSGDDIIPCSYSDDHGLDEALGGEIGAELIGDTHDENHEDVTIIQEVVTIGDDLPDRSWALKVLNGSYDTSFEKSLEQLKQDLLFVPHDSILTSNTLLSFFILRVFKDSPYNYSMEEWNGIMDRQTRFMDIMIRFYQKDKLKKMKHTGILHGILKLLLHCPSAELAGPALESYIVLIFCILDRMSIVQDAECEQIEVVTFKYLNSAIDMAMLLSPRQISHTEVYRKSLDRARERNTKIQREWRTLNRNGDAPFFDRKLKSLSKHKNGELTVDLDGSTQPIDNNIERIARILQYPFKNFDCLLFPAAVTGLMTPQFFKTASNRLVEYLKMCLVDQYQDIKIEVFGSALSELTTSYSDVDINIKTKATQWMSKEIALNAGKAWFKRTLYKQWPHAKGNKWPDIQLDPEYQKFVLKHLALFNIPVKEKSNKEKITNLTKEQMALVMKQVTRVGNKRAPTLHKLVKKIGSLDNISVTEQRLSARVPIIKIRYDLADNQSSVVEADISLGISSIAYNNSLLLKAYSKCIPQCKPLLLLVKRWAKSTKVSNAANGYLSSYTYNILVIYYLQRRGMLPCFHETKKYPNGEPIKETPIFLCKKYIPEEGKIKDININVLRIDPDKITNEKYSVAGSFKDTLMHLFRGFLLFYVFQFDFNKNIVSIRNTKPMLRTDPNLPPTPWWAWSIEDPYEHFHTPCPRDLGCVLKIARVAKIRTEMKRALLMLYNSIDVKGSNEKHNNETMRHKDMVSESMLADIFYSNKRCDKLSSVFDINKQLQGYKCTEEKKKKNVNNSALDSNDTKKGGKDRPREQITIMQHDKRNIKRQGSTQYGEQEENDATNVYMYNDMTPNITSQPYQSAGRLRGGFQNYRQVTNQRNMEHENNSNRTNIYNKYADTNRTERYLENHEATKKLKNHFSSFGGCMSKDHANDGHMLSNTQIMPTNQGQRVMMTIMDAPSPSASIGYGDVIFSQHNGGRGHRPRGKAYNRRR